MPYPWILPRGSWRKRLYFHRTVEMKQPQTITEPSVFPLELQGKSINHFYNTAFKKESAIFYDAAFLLWKGFGNIW